MRYFFLSLLFLLNACQHSSVILAHYPRQDLSHIEASGTHYAISTQGIFATKAAQSLFSQGGNIVDAAVAASFAISVERPQSTGLGGGGFMLFRDVKTNKTYAIDFRERAPLRATKNMYVDTKGQVVAHLSTDSVFAVAVPGLVAGLLKIHERFGHLPLEQVMKPAIDLAQTGFAIYGELFEAIQSRASVLKNDPEAKKIFFDEKGNPWAVGHILVQKDLANTLRLIAKNGRKGFYKGFVAQQITKLFKEKRGLIAQADLDTYRVKWREPVHGNFHGSEVYSMPPPSSGGVHVLQFLNILRKDNLKDQGVLSAQNLHLEAAALQAAFADRARYLGDPDFVKVPVRGLISYEYAQKRRQEIPLDHARPSSEVQPGNPLPYESPETTHLSLMDAEGNAVSTTQTINGWFGAGIVVPQTGIVLNNEMDDFSAQVGSSNMFGAIGGKANAIAPQKTPLSSMSPTILVRDGKPWLTLGAPGGTRIISCVAQTILNRVEYELPLRESISMIRYHHQWMPDELDLEPPGPGNATVAKLKKMGYKVEIKPVGCRVMAVEKIGNTLHGVSDPRDIGTSAAE